MLSLIVAMAHNRVIGKSNDLPWYLPADLRHFKQITTGRTVIMGRKTYESIVNRLGKPLPDRTNIVITRDQQFAAPGAKVAHSLDEALAEADSEEVFVIGGAQIYELALPIADRLYVTEVDADIAGDVLFPDFKAADWQEISRETHQADEKNPYNFSFVVLGRREPGATN